MMHDDLERGALQLCAFLDIDEKHSERNKENNKNLLILFQ